MLYFLYVDVPVTDQLTLSVELGVQLRVLPLPVVVDGPLLVDLGPQRLDETDVGVHARLVVFVHPPLIFVETAEVLLEAQQLVLQRPVVALLLAQISRLLHELGNHTLLLGRLACAVTTCAVGVRVAYHSLPCLALLLHCLALGSDSVHLRDVVGVTLEASLNLAALRTVSAQRACVPASVDVGPVFHLSVAMNWFLRLFERYKLPL